jgi:hypothetical protein
MKTKIAIVSVCMMIGLFVLDEELKMRSHIQRGQVIHVNPASGVFAGGPVIIDKIDGTITSKASTFPVILWTDTNGAIKSQRHFAQSRIGMSISVPANKEEIAFYREYFPKS